jgi:hypothetical protein
MLQHYVCHSLIPQVLLSCSLLTFTLSSAALVLLAVSNTQRQHSATCSLLA